MMGTKVVPFITCLLLSASALASDVRYAIIQLDGAGHGMLVTDAPLASGASVSIQYPGGKHSTVCCKRLAAADFSKASVDGFLATDEVGGKQPLTYRVRVPKAWAESPFIGVAVVGDGLRTRNVRGQLESIDKRGRVRRAGICTSQEGVHLLEKVGSAERTHLYLSLGYEVESPTCR
jgi:hypothetical protein